MADLSQYGGYDQNAEASQFDRIPAGTYQAAIVESEIVDISDREDKGRCLKLTWKLMGGDFEGRLFWQRIYLYAANMSNLDKVISIANSQFAAVRQATGKVAPRNSDELHNIPCMITIGPQKNDANYDEVKSVRAIEGQGGQPPKLQTTQQSSSSSSSQRSNGNGANKPWGNRATG